MSQVFRKQKLSGFRGREAGAVFSDILFDHCFFEDCHVSMTTEHDKRSVLRRVEITDCEQRNCKIWPAILEDIAIDGLVTTSLLIANACAYKHVVLRGNVGSIKLCKSIPAISGPAVALARRQEAMDRANAEYYRAVDWALDISEAVFESGEVEGIPPHLLKRDPETQVIVRFDAIQRRLWEGVDLSGTYWSAVLDGYRKRAVGDTVLIAPKAHKDFGVLLRGLNALRAAGVAEPD